MNNHLMLDIETAGTGPHAYVLTIGMLRFDPYGPETNDVGFHLVVPYSMNTGRNIDIGTMKWWMQQSPMAQGQAFLATPDTEQFVINSVIGELNACDHLWANDPDFDCVIVKDWLDKHYEGFRWPYRTHRSIRTLKALFDIGRIEPVGVAHNALDDCRSQAQIVRAVYQGKAPPTFYAEPA